jgi:hypothetical protein
MKIAAVVDPIEASGLGAGNVFSIATNSKAFEILSRQVYSDPVAAVIREITCNAADAHKLTGRPISDIEIKLPNIFEPEFYVRDYGPGLSVADVCGLYTTYFASTKDQSNDMIGGFGIGSKSPFAVSDQFTITSWHGGFCSEFVCYKENGAPRINMIRSTPSDEPTGLKVQVATSNATAWEHAATQFFKWWPEVPSCLSHIKPIFDGLPHKSAHMEGSLAKWYMQPNTDNSYVLMGGVRYQIDKSKVPYFSKLAADWRTHSHSLILVAPLGAVSPQPSREQLNYNEDTVSWLDAAAAYAINELHAEALTSFKQITTLYEARKFCHEYEDTLPYWHIIRDQFKFNGDHVPIRITSYTQSFSVTRYTRFHYSTMWRTSRDYLEHNFSDGMPIHFLWLPTPATGTHYKRIRNEHPTQSAQMYHLLWGDTLDNIQAQLDKEGFPPDCLIDFTTKFPTLPPAPRKKRNTAPIPRDLRGYPQVQGSRFSFAEAQELLDLSVPGYYVETHAGAINDLTVRDIFQFICQHMTAPVVKINGSQLSDRTTKGLKRAGWTEITSSFFHDQPNSFIDPFINSTLMDNILIPHNLRSNYAPKLPANSTLKLALTNLTIYISPTISHSVHPDKFISFLSDDQKKYLEDRKKHFATLLAAAKLEVDKFPLLPYMNLTDKVVPAILDYLST